jgi:hypothetical protein
MTVALDQADLDDLQDFIRIQVAAGYSPISAVVDEAVDVFADNTLPAEALRSAAFTLAETTLAAHVEEQATWSETTDCDRLDAAFRALDDAGIVARQHFTCCGNCGATEIHGEMDQARKDGQNVRGYTFFHIQDTEYAVRGESLFLSFGSVDGDAQAAIAVGHDVVSALRAEGLHPAWNGRQSNRIGLPLVWQRRRATS